VNLTLVFADTDYSDKFSLFALLIDVVSTCDLLHVHSLYVLCFWTITQVIEQAFEIKIEPPSGMTLSALLQI